MIINELNHTHKSNIKSKTSAFQIKTTAKAFEILSSGIYSNKIRAVIRELCCNAYDSHVEAGTPELPFTVHLPNSFAPEFSVEDFGVGMSPEVVEELYTTYFSSTKTGTNDLIGGLGLGSKSPFCYTDQFTVRSRKDGIETVYGAFISSEGSPSIQKKSQKETTEPNGVKVSLAVDPSDFQEFKMEAMAVLTYFRVPPNINQIKFIKSSNFDRLDKSGFTSILNWSGGLVVIMGNVAYNVSADSSVLSKFKDEWIKKELTSNRRYFVKFDIGELNVAASRETISFDEDTTEVFVNRITKLFNDELENLQVTIDAIPDLLDKISYISDNFQLDGFFGKSAMFNDKSIHEWANIRTSSFFDKYILTDSNWKTEHDVVRYIDSSGRRYVQSLRDIYGTVNTKLRYIKYFVYFNSPESKIGSNQLFNWIRRMNPRANVLSLSKTEIRDLPETYTDLEGNEVHKKTCVQVAVDQTDIDLLSANINKYFSGEEKQIQILNAAEVEEAWLEHREEVRQKAQETRRLRQLEMKKNNPSAPKPIVVRVKKNEVRCAMITKEGCVGTEDFNHIVNLDDAANGRYLIANTFMGGTYISSNVISSSLFESYSNDKEQLVIFSRSLIEIFGLDGILLTKTPSQLEKIKNKIEKNYENHTALYNLTVDDIQLPKEKMEEIILYRHLTQLYASRNVGYELDFYQVISNSILYNVRYGSYRMVYKQLMESNETFQQAKEYIDYLNETYYNTFNGLYVGSVIRNLYTDVTSKNITELYPEINNEVAKQAEKDIESKYPLLTMDRYEVTDEMKEVYIEAMNLYHASKKENVQTGEI